MLNDFKNIIKSLGLTKTGICHITLSGWTHFYYSNRYFINMPNVYFTLGYIDNQVSLLMLNRFS